MKQKKLRYTALVFMIALIMFVTTPVLVDDIGDKPPAPAAASPRTGERKEPEYTPSPEAAPATDPADIPFTPGAEITPLPPAADITYTLTVTLPDGASPDTLQDRDYTTKRVFRADDTIEITAPEPIYSLYLIWDKPPGEWYLNTGTDGVITAEVFGANEFIHEYITPGNPASEIALIIPPGGAALCDIYAFTDGYPPEWVQTWLPPLEKADMLVLPTHADDEHLFFVGTMPYYAGERGYNVQVAYMTNHWNEPPRPHELLDGLWTAGIRNYPVISSFNDRYAATLQDAQSIYGYGNIVDYHVQMLRRFKPSVVVGHDINGEYGHGAHMLNARALTEAVEKAADAEYHEPSKSRYGIWDTPKLYLHLYVENAIIMDWDIPLESFGGATAREMAVKGYDCHISQHEWSFAVPPAGSTGTGSKFGLVRTLVGPDKTGGDMFENIVT